MNLVIGFVFAVFCAASAFAQDVPLSSTKTNIYEYFSAVDGARVSIHIYNEQNHWIVQKSKIALDGLPDPAGEWSFGDEAAAYAFAKSELGVAEVVRFDGALDFPAPEILALVPLDLPTLTANSLWISTQKWNWEWEIAFAKWTRENLHPGFFEELGIENDCADAFYQARMIFARINKLPISFRLAAGGVYFTERTVRDAWKKLKTNDDWKKDRRFMAALDYVANTTYTHTLGRDTYPVELSGEALLAGTAYLSISGTSGHTLIVNEINLGEGVEVEKTRLPMYTLNSTVPKGLQPLYESFFHETAQPERSDAGFTGFVRFRWPKAIGSATQVEAADMPHYSLEQYNSELLNVDGEAPEPGTAAANFSLFVFKRLDPNYDPVLRVTEGVKALTELLTARADVVEKGYEACKSGCDPKGPVYDAWSTPSRDKRLILLMKDLQLYSDTFYDIIEVGEVWAQALESPILRLGAEDYTLKHVKWTFENDFHSSDPNLAPGSRWGLEAKAFAQAAYTQMEPLLQARKVKIENGVQCAECDIFAPEFMLSSTFVEDAEMNRLVALRSQYCAFAGEKVCPQFSAALKALPTLVPGHSDFEQTWNGLATLNSDPRLAASSRWGQLSIAGESLKLDGSYFPAGQVKSKNLVLLRRDDSTAHYIIVNTQTQKVISKISLDSFENLTPNPELPIAVTKTEATKSVEFYNLLTAEKFQSTAIQGLGAEAYLYDTIWLDAKTVLLSSSDTAFIFTEHNGQYVLAETLPGFQVSGRFLTKTSFESVTYISLNDPTRTPVTLGLKAALGGTVPSYISTENISDKVFLVSWSFYSDTSSLSGKLLVNSVTKSVARLEGYPEYFSYDRGVIYITEYINNVNTTEIRFVDDQLKVVNSYKFDSSCSNCYGGTEYIQLGDTVYKVDREAVAIYPVATISSGYQLNDTFDNMGIFNVYDDVTYENSSVLVSFDTGTVLAIAPTLSLLNAQAAFYPYISANTSITKEFPDATGVPVSRYFNFTLFLDPLQASAPSIASVATIDASVGGEGEGEEFEGGGGVMAGLLPVTSSTLTLGADDFKPLKLVRPVVKIFGKGMAPTENERPLRLLNIDATTSILVFR